MTEENWLDPDGLPARESHLYALEKLYYTERYQQIFATGMKNKWSNRIYIDLMAGPGRCELPDGRHVEGSPLRSFNAEFTDRIFVEYDVDLMRALDARVGPSRTATMFRGDCNDSWVVDQLVDRLRAPHTLGLAFIDNLGLDVPFSTIQAITSGGARVDLLVVFQLQDLTRNVGAALAGRQDPTRFDAYFGSPGWQDVAQAATREHRSPSEVADRLMAYYARQLQTIGYDHTAGGAVAMRNSKNATQYRLLIASRHVRAIEFFRKIERIEYGGQRTLFG